MQPAKHCFNELYPRFNVSTDTNFVLINNNSNIQPVLDRLSAERFSGEQDRCARTSAPKLTSVMRSVTHLQREGLKQSLVAQKRLFHPVFQGQRRQDVHEHQEAQLRELMFGHI